MRSFPRAQRRRVNAAVVTAVVLVGALIAPSADAGSSETGRLRDKEKQVQKQIEAANHDLELSSVRLRKATEKVNETLAELAHARSELVDARTKLVAAQALDAQLRAELDAAEAKLAQAQQDLSLGQVAVVDQRQTVADTVVEIYQQGDPRLIAFTSLLNAQTPSDITRRMMVNSSLINKEGNAYEDLQEAEAALQEREHRVADATAEVAHKQQEAADHVIAMEELANQTLAAKEQVKSRVADSREAELAAEQARRHDRKQIRILKQQEAEIQELIQEAIRRAKAKARAEAKAAAAAAAAAGAANDAPVVTDGLLQMPVNGSLTSPFGYRDHPIYHYWGLHDGDDFSASCGAPLVASGDGTVLAAYYSSIWGNRLYINLGLVNGKMITVIYNHLSAYDVSVGQSVTRGQTVGRVGTTGWSTGCHLHFTVMENGTPVDPMNYL